jgi:hypothetical protein
LLSELSWYPRKEEGNLQFGSNQVVLATDARGAVAVDTAAAICNMQYAMCKTLKLFA